jgi:hypothetical protein
MKEIICKWLKDNNITDYTHLRANHEFVDFLVSSFPDKTEAEILRQILSCAVAIKNDIDAFCGCLGLGLSN